MFIEGVQSHISKIWQRFIEFLGLIDTKYSSVECKIVMKSLEVDVNRIIIPISFIHHTSPMMNSAPGDWSEKHWDAAFQYPRMEEQNLCQHLTQLTKHAADANHIMANSSGNKKKKSKLIRDSKKEPRRQILVLLPKH